MLSRGESLGLALQTCTHCTGLGQRASYGDMEIVCECVWRAIFRRCHSRFRVCSMRGKHSRSQLEINGAGHSQKQTWCRKDEEYSADFVLIAKRVLSQEQYETFRYHFVFGETWKGCTAKLGISRGAFFHSLYRIQVLLGRHYRITKPYGLFPLDEYFGANGGTAVDGKKRIADRLERLNTLAVNGFSLPQSCGNAECGFAAAKDSAYCSEWCAQQVNRESVLPQALLRTEVFA